MGRKENRGRIDGRDGEIAFLRNRHGIPEITANSHVDLAHGLGWVHARDRQLQAILTRVLLAGRAAEKLSADPALVEIDRFMRRINFLPDGEQQIRDLDAEAERQLRAYASGFNRYLYRFGPVYEFKLLGYEPEAWDIRDSLILGKAFGFLGLADAQGAMEKFLVQMIQNGVPDDKLRELFPYLTEPIDRELFKKIKLAPPIVPQAALWLQTLPKFTASNNWAVSGEHTLSGKPILCGDPHLEINRLPAIWQEVVLRLPDETLMGVTVPGSPGLVIGRTNRIAWSATYSFMDMLDYRIEQCRDSKYWREDGWRPFAVRTETIQRKKKDPIKIRVYENEHGLLEGDPNIPGHYLVQSWSARSGCGAGDYNALLALPRAKNVRQAMNLLKNLDAASFNFVIADSGGDIGYQMSGRQFDRPPGVSGLLPLPGWDASFDPVGFVDKDRLPAQFNPKDGILVTANQDLNALGQSAPINLPMATYRADRIRQLLARQDGWTVEQMKTLHYDLVSLQARRLMETIRPLLPHTQHGKTLKEWDCRYDAGSIGAMLFESVWHELIRTVFGDGGLGRDVVDHLFFETSLFNDYYGNLDDILFKEESAWFEPKTRQALFARAIDKGLDVKPAPYGSTRKVVLSHLLFGAKLPRFLGFDAGPIQLPGCRATIPQGQIFKSAGRVTTFSPSYRMIADLGTTELHTNLPGGPTDRRFSRWYLSDLKNWMNGIYKVLE